jgi:hypothetical protein
MKIANLPAPAARRALAGKEISRRQAQNNRLDNLWPPA